MISDAEREATVVELRRVAEDGRLDPGSLDVRVQLARSARTYEDLSAALHGLGAVRGGAPAAYARPGLSREDPLRLNGRGSAEKRSGHWEIPPFLRVHAALSAVRLDCLDAVALEPHIDLEVVPGLAAVRLVLPEGWAVDVDRLGKGLGSIKSTVPSVPEPGCPVFVAYGSIGVASFRASGPGWLERRRRGPIPA